MGIFNSRQMKLFAQAKILLTASGIKKPKFQEIIEAMKQIKEQRKHGSYKRAADSDPGWWKKPLTEAEAYRQALRQQVEQAAARRLQEEAEERRLQLQSSNRRTNVSKEIKQLADEFRAQEAAKAAPKEGPKPKGSPLSLSGTLGTAGLGAAAGGLLGAGAGIALMLRDYLRRKQSAYKRAADPTVAGIYQALLEAVGKKQLSPEKLAPLAAIHTQDIGTLEGMGTGAGTVGGGMAVGGGVGGLAGSLFSRKKRDRTGKEYTSSWAVPGAVLGAGLGGLAGLNYLPKIREQLLERNLKIAPPSGKSLYDTGKALLPKQGSYKQGGDTPAPPATETSAAGTPATGTSSDGEKSWYSPLTDSLTGMWNDRNKIVPGTKQLPEGAARLLQALALGGLGAGVGGLAGLILPRRTSYDEQGRPVSRSYWKQLALLGAGLGGVAGLSSTPDYSWLQQNQKTPGGTAASAAAP
jgi:hypothetical protein